MIQLSVLVSIMPIDSVFNLFGFLGITLETSS